MTEPSPPERGPVVERLAFVLARRHGIDRQTAIDLAVRVEGEGGPGVPGTPEWFAGLVRRARFLAQAQAARSNPEVGSTGEAMLPIEITCPHCGTRRRYEPPEYVGEFLICRGCARMVEVSDFYPQASPEARREMWLDPGMRPYLRNAGLPEAFPGHKGSSST